jgi:ATP-dependent Clp protease adapter protein ClpS
MPEIEVLERVLPSWIEDQYNDTSEPYIVILYNDDCHGMGEVILQAQKATGYDLERCIAITLEAHHLGRAIAYTGSEAKCECVARILRHIRLQVETDRL